MGVKILNKIVADQTQQHLKGLYTMIKPYLFLGCKNGSHMQINKCNTSHQQNEGQNTRW
jgi:hypothetical protein